MLIERHERRVFLTLLKRGVRVDLAKDILQDTWARLIDQQREGRLQKLELPGLAITQAMFLAMEDARRQSRSVPLEEPPGVSLMSDPPPTIEEQLGARAALDCAASELARAPPRTACLPDGLRRTGCPARRSGQARRDQRAAREANPLRGAGTDSSCDGAFR